MAGRGRGRGRGTPQQGGGRGRGAAYPPPLISAAPSVQTPAANVTSVEDQVIQSNTGQKQSKLPDISQLTLSQRLPNRPAYGNQGTKVVLKANYFELNSKGGSKVFRYNVEIDPGVTGKKRMRVFEQLLNESRIQYFAPGLASDFKATLITTKAIEDMSQIDVRYRAEGEDLDSTGGQLYHVKLQLTGQFNVSDLIDYLTSTSVSAAFGQELELIQSLNIILGHYAKAQPASAIMSIGSNRHYPLPDKEKEKSFDLGRALEALRGYIMSTRASTARILLNVQVKSAPTYKSVRLDALMKEFTDVYSGDCTAELERFVKKLNVEPIHLERKNSKGGRVLKVKIISAVATTADGEGLQHRPHVKKFGAAAKEVEFYLDTKPPKLKKKGATVKVPGYISVYDFFDKVHNVQANDSHPVVNVGNKANPVYLPAVVCQVTPGQPAKARLNPTQTSAMIRFAVRPPSANASSITTDGRTTLGLNTNPTLAAFGLTVGPDLITVHGRMLNSPPVYYKQNKRLEARHGSWNMGENQFSKASTLKAWSVIWIVSDPKKDPWGNKPPELEATLLALTNILRKYGMNASNAIRGTKVELTGNDDLSSKINSGFQKLLGKGLELILVITPERNETMYSSIKYYGDIIYGIRTICVQASNLSKNDNRLLLNMALKFNLKMGGNNQTLDSNKLGIIGGGKAMVVGIDVTHPSPGSADSAPSVAGMVASIDKNLNQFPAILSVQKARKEMVEDLANMFKTRLQLWTKLNKELPEIIIVCRDGVSEGQYDIVVDEELPLLKSACRDLYPKNRQPSLSVIIVGKRHNTRFYPTTLEGDKLDHKQNNPRNGTVVDRGVTQARNWDFFLQSHEAVQGTARPAHYFVVHDEIFKTKPLPPGKNAAEALEELIHNMCYTFGRATKAVSICPPAYYADLVCERARLYLRQLYSPDVTPAASQSGSQGAHSDQQSLQVKVQIHDNIKNTMFYI